MAVPTNLINKFAAITTTSTSLSTIFTHSSSLKNPDGSAGQGGVLDSILVYNQDSITHTIELFRVGSGLSAGTSNLIDRISIGSLSPYRYIGPLWGASGDFYQARLAEAATSQTVAFQVFYHEMS